MRFSARNVKIDVGQYLLIVDADGEITYREARHTTILRR